MQTTQSSRNWNERHLSDEELIGILYETAADPHVQACLHCRGRLQSLELVRRRHLAQGATGITDRTLAQQRANIYAQLDSRPHTFGSRWLWAGAPLAAAAALLVTINVGSLTPVVVDPVAPVAAQQAPAVAEAVANDTLYADIYQTLSQEAPAGVYAVAGMFDAAKASPDAAPVKD